MARVVLLGVVCDLSDPPRPEDYPPRDPDHVGWSPITRELVEQELASGRYDDPAQQWFNLSEFAELDDGRRLTIREDRGFGGRSSDGDYWRHVTRARLTFETLSAVGPDEGDQHPPHEWIVERLRDLGCPVDPASVETAPYRVDFTDRVLERLLH